MALLYNVVANIWHLRKCYFKSNGANPCSILKNFIELSNSWSVASYIYDPLLPSPPKKKFKNSNNNNNNKPNCPCNTHRKLSHLFCFNLFFNSYPSPFFYSQWIPWLLHYLHRQSSHLTADNLSRWCSTWRLHILISWKHHILKWGRLAFETITGKFRPQKHHWRSHLVRQVCMRCNQVIILQDRRKQYKTIFTSCSRDHVPLWSYDLSWLISCSLMGKPSGVVSSWATHNSLI